jgi:hypothetical protein
LIRAVGKFSGSQRNESKKRGEAVERDWNAGKEFWKIRGVYDGVCGFCCGEG